MEAFSPTPPPWTDRAKHALEFCCPICQRSPREAKEVWINRRSPLYTENQGRRWQEFYLCACDHSWWSWNTERPPSSLAAERRTEE